MSKQHIDAVFISDAHNIFYLTGYNGFSSTEREAYLLVTKDKVFLIVSPLHAVEVKNRVKHVEILERTSSNSLTKLVKEVVKRQNIKICGFEEKNLTVSEFNILLPILPKFKPADISTLRLIKDIEEIIAIKKACEIGDKAYSHILKNLRTGMTEKNMAFELEWFIRKSGVDISFETIVAFEENAAVPHHKTGNQKLKKNQFVLIDLGVKYENYCSDMTRTFVYGKATDEQKKVYQTVLTAQQKAIEYIEKSLVKKEKPIATKVDGAARDFVLDQEYPPFNHSSHGIGLEVHELPHITRSHEPLENGMVFSIEPGIYLTDKFGVRIEDLFAIQNNKLLQLTHSPKTLLEI